MAGMSARPGDEYHRDWPPTRDVRRSFPAGCLVSSARIVTFGLGAALLMRGGGAGAGAWLVLHTAAFAVLIQRHDLVVRGRAAAQRSVQFYERDLRDRRSMAGTGEAGDASRDRISPQ